MQKQTAHISPNSLNISLDIEATRIAGWKGYKVIGKKYNICERILPLNFKNLADRMYEEMNRLRQLEPTMKQIKGGRLRPV